jgi:hypothetical protein
MSNQIGVDKRGNHTSPTKSKFYQDLLYAARKNNQDEEILRNILWLLNANDHLSGIRRIARNLQLLLPNIHKVYDNSFEDAAERPIFDNWEPILEWISTALPAEICPEGGGAKNPNQFEAFKRNPLWADLWENADGLDFAQQYRWLEAHFVIAHARQLYFAAERDSRLGRAEYESYGGKVIWDALPDLNYEAALRLRQLGRGKWKPVFERMPMSVKAKRFVRDLSDIQTAPGDDKLVAAWPQFRETIRAFLARANGFEPWSERDLTGKPRLKPSVVVSIATEDATPGDPDDPDTRGWPDGKIVTIAASLSKELVQAALDCDLNPEELREQAEYYVAPVWDTGQLQKLAIERAISVRGQYRHIQIQHQLLPFAYDIPAAHEIRCLLNRLDNSWKSLGAPHEWDQQKKLAAETITLILIQLWFGFSARRAHSVVVISRTDCLENPSQGGQDGKLIYNRLNSEWIVPIDAPPYRSVIPDPARHAHVHLQRLPLQDVAGVGRYVETLLKHREVSDQSRSTSPSGPVAVFPGTLEDYEGEARAYLRDDESTRRITVRRVGLFAFHRLVARCGDLMAGALITGRMGTLTRTERFYASYPPADLRRLYFETACEMVRDVTGEDPPEPQPVLNPEFWSGHVGARLCAKDAEVKRAVADIKAAYYEVRKEKRLSGERHNLMTLYSVMFFCFSTSCRPIRTPYIWIHRVDPETNFAYLTDKDDDAHHKARLVWIPPTCLHQMKHYEQQCDRLRRQHPAIKKWPAPCFFLAENRRPRFAETVQPATIAPKLKRFLQLPLNFYRVYLRHRLLETGTPPEIVMAWLGHAFAGEEIWNPHSALSPREYVECISKPLTEILEKELEWGVLK